MEQVTAEFRRKFNKRVAEANKITFLCNNMQKWSTEREVRRYQEQLEKQQLEDEEKQNEMKMSLLSQRKSIRDMEATHLKQDLIDSQNILSAMKCNGTIAGTNPKIPPKKQPQHILSRHVEVQLREDLDFNSIPKPHRSKDRVSPVTVDLMEYRNALHITARNIGERGALYLAADFIRGATPRLEILDLSRCMIQSRGFGKLLHGIRIGNLINLQTLTLRGNNITARGADHLVNSLRHGALTDLRVLTLDENELGDRGASVLAHGILEGLFMNLTQLGLKRNGIGDDGFGAVAKVIISARYTKCPELSILAMQENFVTAEAKRQFDPIPACLSV